MFSGVALGDSLSPVIAFLDLVLPSPLRKGASRRQPDSPTGRPTGPFATYRYRGERVSGKRVYDALNANEDAHLSDAAGGSRGAKIARLGEHAARAGPASSSRQRLVQVVDQVVDRFDADRKPD